MEGYIKLHRQLLSHPIFAHQTALKIWIWMLLKANHKRRPLPLKVGKGTTIVTVNKGEFIFGRFKAEEQLNIDGSTIYKWIKKFEKELNLIKVKSNNQYSVISIVNWAEYQNIEEIVTTKEQPRNNQVTTEEQPSNTNKNVKNEENNNISWKKDIEIYKQDLRDAYNEIMNDPKWLQERETYHPKVDIKLTIDKSIKDFWITELGWKNKKNKRTAKICWRNTFNNILSHKPNIVWKE